MNTALSRQNKYTLHGLGYPKVSNPGFDVTPAHLVSGLITEKNCSACFNNKYGRAQKVTTKELT